MQELSETTWELVRRIFPPERQAEVAGVLSEECGDNLPGYKDADKYKLERVRFAVLKLSRGDVARLHDAAELARGDWRDLLTEAGFDVSLLAHHEWARRQLTSAGAGMSWLPMRESSHGCLRAALVSATIILLIMWPYYVRPTSLILMNRLNPAGVN